MNSLWFLRASGTMPARNAALNSVVDVVQMPPPNAPVTVIFPPSIALPGPTPGALCRLPTSFQKSNLAPAGTTVPLSTVAGPSMFPPKWLLTMCWYQTLYELMTFILPANALASVAVSFGSTALTTAATGDAGVPACRAAIALMIAVFIPSASNVRPSWLDPVATTCPPTSLRPASCAGLFTSLASFLRIGSRPVSSRTGVMVPSAEVENEISGARLVPAIVQLSLPRATAMSATIRSAAAFAASAEVVATAGANGTTGTAAVIDAGVSSDASCASSVVSRAALSTARPSFAGETLNVPPAPTDVEASTGAWSIVVARVSTAVASLSWS